MPSLRLAEAWLHDDAPGPQAAFNTMDWLGAGRVSAALPLGSPQDSYVMTDAWTNEANRQACTPISSTLCHCCMTLLPPVQLQLSAGCKLHQL